MKTHRCPQPYSPSSSAYHSLNNAHRSKHYLLRFMGTLDFQRVHHSESTSHYHRGERTYICHVGRIQYCDYLPPSKKSKHASNYLSVMVADCFLLQKFSSLHRVSLMIWPIRVECCTVKLNAEPQAAPRLTSLQAYRFLRLLPL
jgi:hypothetical protein